jgi:hypothetical protein
MIATRSVCEVYGGRYRWGGLKLKTAPLTGAVGNFVRGNPFRDQLAYFFFFVAAFFAGAFFAAFLVAFFIDRVSLTSLRFAIAGSQCDSYIKLFETVVKRKVSKNVA